MGYSQVVGGAGWRGVELGVWENDLSDAMGGVELFSQIAVNAVST